MVTFIFIAFSWLTIIGYSNRDKVVGPEPLRDSACVCHDSQKLSEVVPDDYFRPK